jgi:AraC family ethanolamine operon transcriptional activator
MSSLSTETIPADDTQLAVMSVKMDSFIPQSMEEALSNTNVEHLQLERGRFHGQLIHARFTNSSMDYGGYNLPLLATSGMPSDKITLGYILAADGESIMNGKSFTAPSAVLFAEGTELHYRLAANTQWLALQIERDLLESVGLSIQQDSAGPAGASSAGDRKVSQKLQNTLSVLQTLATPGTNTAIPDASRCIKQVEAHLFDLLIGTFASANSSTQQQSMCRPEAVRMVEKITDYLHANIAEPLQITRICSEMECDLKTAERAFHTIHGMAPRQFLTLLRFNKSRRMLLDRKAKKSVTEIATACGIQHLGRFSQQYHMWFGERPTETRARSMDSG